MNEKKVAPSPDGEDEPKFDVFVHRPPEITLEEVRRRAIEQLGLPAEKVESLIKALRSSPHVQLGKEVSKARADKARVDMAKLGLEVEANPVLSLMPLNVSLDGKMNCPACGERADMGPERQCPACGVYVDKVSPEMLLRKKILEQERGRIAWRLAQQQAKDEPVETPEEMEARLRDEIRDELERQNGLERPGLSFLQKVANMRAVPAAALLSVVFGGVFAAGWMVEQARDTRVVPGVALTTRVVPMDAEALLARMDEMPPAAGRVASSVSPSALDDSLDHIVRVRRTVGEGLTLDRAMAALDADPASVVTQKVGSLPPLPTEARARLLADLALHLAQMGQGARANEVMNTLGAWKGTTDADLAARLRRTRLLVDAWSLADLSSQSPRSRMDGLKAGAAAIADPAERAATLGAVGRVLAQQVHLAPELSKDFLTLAALATKAVTDVAARDQATAQWWVDFGQTLLVSTQQAARSGQATRSRALSDELAGMAAKAPGGVPAARLHAMLAQTARLSGQADTVASAALQASLAQVARLNDLAAQAATLRELNADLVPADRSQVAAAAERLAGKADTAAGPARAQLLTQLALLAADAGKTETFLALRQRALQVTGVPLDVATALRAELVVGGELAQAQVLHRAGDFAKADQGVQRVAGYLL
jgi:hypothetical protein